MLRWKCENHERVMIHCSILRTFQKTKLDMFRESRNLTKGLPISILSSIVNWGFSWLSDWLSKEGDSYGSESEEYEWLGKFPLARVVNRITFYLLNPDTSVRIFIFIFELGKP